MKLKIATLTVAAGMLVVPASASATDAEIQQAIKDASVKIIKAEQRADRTGSAFQKNPTRTTLRKFRAAARAEEKLVKDIAEKLEGLQPDTPTVGEGRDLIVKGLGAVGTGLDRIDKALGKAKAGKEKAAKRSIRKALEEIDEGNELIEQGEPKAGAELTPNAS
jgi:hypothetical protein